MESVSKIYLKLRYYFKLWRLNLDLKSTALRYRVDEKRFENNETFGKR